MKSDNIKENLSSALKAMTKEQNLEINFTNIESNFFALNNNLIAGKKINLPQIFDEININKSIYFRDTQNNKKDYLNFTSNNQISKTSFSKINKNNPQNNSQNNRAIYDLAACYKIFHQETKLSFDYELQNFLNNFEKIRVISLMKNSYFGASKNIIAKIEKDIEIANNNLELILLNRVFENHLGKDTKKYIEKISQNIDEKILQNIKNLSKYFDNQSQFSKNVIKIFEELKDKEKQQKPQEQKDLTKQNQQESLKKTQENQENIDKKDENFNQKAGDKNQLENKNVEQNLFEENFTDEENQEDEDKTIENDINSLTANKDISKKEVNFATNKKYEIDKIEFINPYKIYSKKYDEVIFPQKIISKEDLLKLRTQLDFHLTKIEKISNKLISKLKRKLLAKKDDITNFNQNEGILNRKKLVNLILNHQTPNIWINNKLNQYQETALTILLDNSGSMRGRPIIMSALACQIIVEILEKFQIKTEIIGFTTGDWKGGRVKKMWEINGKPKNPGRLNELRHIIYKSFNQSFQKSKINLALMLKEGLLKENIDGEALLFAKSRLLNQSQKRKIMMIISDGTPVDDSTALANDEDILSNHLKSVISNIKKERKIEVAAIGIGHIVGDFYQNSITIKSLDDLGNAMIEKLLEIF